MRAARTEWATSCLAGGASSGALLALATAPGDLGPVAFVALSPFLVVVVRARSSRAGSIAGGALGLVLFGAGFHWVPLELGGPVLAAVFLSGVPLLSLPIAALGSSLGWLARRTDARLALAAFPAAWVGIEALRASGPLGTPWLRLGDALATWPVLAQPAALGGVGLLGGWIAAVNAALAAAAVGGTGRRRAATVAVALLACPLLAGALRLAFAADTGEANRFRVAAVQPDLARGERHVRARFDENLGRLLALSRRARAARADLIVWPESAFEGTGGEQGHPFLGSIANDLEVPVLAGLRRAVPGAPERRWNSVALAEPGGATRVVGNKVRPVPLYERAPDFALADRLAAAGWWPGVVQAADRAGVASTPLARGGEARVGILLCIDAAHPDLARDLRRQGAELLLNPANEAESGSWAARQHAALARLRAIETGLPLVRVANNGPSIWVDGYGREVARLAAGAPGAAVVGVPAALAATPYARWGDAPVWAGLLAPVALAGAGARRSGGVLSSEAHELRPLRGGRA